MVLRFLSFTFKTEYLCGSLLCNLVYFVALWHYCVGLWGACSSTVCMVRGETGWLVFAFIFVFVFVFAFGFVFVFVFAFVFVLAASKRQCFLLSSVRCAWWSWLTNEFTSLLWSGATCIWVAAAAQNIWMQNAKCTGTGSSTGMHLVPTAPG